MPSIHYLTTCYEATYVIVLPCLASPPCFRTRSLVEIASSRFLVVTHIPARCVFAACIAAGGGGRNSGATSVFADELSFCWVGILHIEF